MNINDDLEKNESDIIEMTEINLDQDIKVEVIRSVSTDNKITSMEYIQLYSSKKENILLVFEHLLLITSFIIGVYITFLLFNLINSLEDKVQYYKTKQALNQSKIMTIIVNFILGIRIIQNWIFGSLFILFKKGIIKKWIKIFKPKLLIEQIFIWQSPFITLSILLTALIKLIVNCKSSLLEIGTSIDILKYKDLLSVLLIYYYIFVILNFILELPIVRRQYLGNITLSRRIGIFDYSIAYIGNFSLITSLILYFFKYKYSNTDISDPDLKSQIYYYYYTIVGVGIHSGLIAIIIGILGYIASLACSKMLILISLIIKFYSIFIFSWSCSLVWFGNHLLKLFCNIDKISPNLNNFPLQDQLAYKGACYTKPNFHLLSISVIIQLILSIITVIYNFLILINKKIWDIKNES